MVAKRPDIMQQARYYCAALLHEGSRTWDAPEEFTEQEQERWRNAIREISDQIVDVAQAIETRRAKRKAREAGGRK